MKNRSGRFLVLIFICISAAIAAMVGCGQTSGIAVPTGYLPGSIGSTGCTVNAYGTCVNTVGGLPTFTTGDTETLTLANSYALQEYEGEPLQAPGTVQVNLSLSPIADPNGVKDYLGTMNIFFQDVNIVHNGTFTNGQSPTQKYRGYTNDYNQQTSSGVYRLFFEDAAGALVVVINGAGGTDTVTTATGQIYFLNFNSTASNPLFAGTTDQNGTYYPPGYVYCWMIDLGPYNCRNFGVPPQNVYGSGDQQVGPFTYLGSFPVNVHAALGI